MIIWTSRLIKARDFGRLAHDAVCQVRKYSGEPYWHHPEEVAETVSIYLQDEDAIIAAFLHDTIEDAKITFNDIKDKFGLRTALFVNELTDIFTSENYPKQNRAWRKRHEAERLAGISNESKTIKLSDLKSNTKSIVDNDPEFAITYLKEKHRVMQSLVGGNPVLYAEVQKQLQENIDKLNVIL